MNNSYCSKLMILVVATIGMAQTSFSQQSLTNFGVSVHGVTLSIELSNRVVTAESTIWLSARIKNSSTNIITVFHGNPPETAVFLANDTGKIYKQLTPKRSGHYYSTYEITIGVDKIFDWTIPVTISKEIEPGDYTLVATRDFSIGNASFELVSDLLKVQIRK